MGKTLLTIAGILSFAIALLHLVIIFIGTPAYRYFGAGEVLAQQAESGSWLPAILTLAIAIVFTVFGLYAWSGAGRIRRLPFLLTGLLVIGGIYTLRGLSVIAQFAAILKGADTVRWAVFSLVSLAIGLVYLLATATNWRELKVRPPT